MTLPLIGRDRVLVDQFTKHLHDKARSLCAYGPVFETSRGNTFKVRLESGHVLKVTVEFERIDNLLHDQEVT